MNRFVSNRKCLVFCLISFALGAAAMRGVTKAGSSEREEQPEKPIFYQRILANERRAKDRRALKAYEDRNVDIAHWVDNIATPTKPDNAAIFYYQAFLLRPDPNEAIRKSIHDIFFDAEPDKQLRTYLGHCMPMIRLAEIASRMTKCTWGILSGSEPLLSAKDLHNQVCYLRDILLVDARTLATDGHYRAALERCLTVRRLAQHLSNSSNDSVVMRSRSPDFMALRMVRRILGLMPPDADILSWFRGQLAVVQGVPLEFAHSLKADFESYLDHVQTSPIPLRYLRNLLIKHAEDEQAKDEIRNLTDEQLLSSTTAPFPDFLDSLMRVDDSAKSYEQKCDEMKSLYDQFENKYGDDFPVKYVLDFAGVKYMITEQYEFQVGHQAHINATKVAVEVYLVVAETGKLPEKLPADLPKDPFTDKDFIYEITEEGFAIRCQSEEFLRRKNKFLEFKIRR